MHCKTLVTDVPLLQGQQLFFNMPKCNFQSLLRNITEYLVSYNNRLSTSPLQICIHMATELPCYQDTILKSALHEDCHLKLTSKWHEMKNFSSLQLCIHACMQNPPEPYSYSMCACIHTHLSHSALPLLNLGAGPKP